MPPSLKYRLIGGGTAWATSLAEARVHHPGRVDGPWDEQPWNIYLVGHGYTTVSYTHLDVYKRQS